MSAFQVGDRVKYDGPVNGANSGTVTGIDGVLATVRWDDGISLVYGVSVLSPLAPAPPVAVAPMAIGDLVHPSGAKMEAGPAFRVTYSAPVWGDSRDIIDQLTAAEVNELLKARADLLAARDEHRAMRAALDKVRVFFASHRFDSLGVAAGRELREVMAVVLTALDAERAGK